MHSFIEKFKVEVSEYCERLESGLLELEHDPENQQVIGEIFRIMHSMKGSGGMFGFDLLSDVTHDLESLYDLYRSKKYRIDSEAISFTLHSIDGLQNLMVQEPTGEHRMLAEKMKSETRQQIARITGLGSIADEATGPANTSSPESDTDCTTYYITFIPDGNIFSNGTNPLYLIDELNALGECNIQVSFDRLPHLAVLDPSLCYLSWYLFIATSENVETLQDVFIFASDLAQIQIEKVSAGNVIHREHVLAGFLNSKLNGEEWTPDLPVPDELKPAAEILPAEEKAEEVSMTAAPELPKDAAFAPSRVDSIRVDSVKIDQYMNLVSELITAQSRLEVISSGLNHPELELVTETFRKYSRQLRENAFDMSLIPLQTVVMRFKRLVFDLSKSLGKEVELVTSGMETELDKNIIEKLIEPLLHMIRNSLDHGLETKEIRQKKQKNLVGTISIHASTIGSFVQIEVEDDGAGLDPAKIRQKAIEKGIIAGQSVLGDEEIYQLIFEPDFSTSGQVTDLSGRGVGMDVVRKRVHEMRGSIQIDTEKERYTRFTIKLPLSLSIIDGLLTTVGDSYYVIPSSVIKKIYAVKSHLLKKEFRQVLELEGDQLPYLNMHEELDAGGLMPEELYAVVVSFGNQSFGIVVDQVIREYQAVIKPLGRLLKGQDVFSGASILGTGQLALVMDINKMILKYT